jgi:hypothetical protein
MGGYSVQCDRTGFRADVSECVEQWNGLFVLKEVAEERHPQERLRVRREDTSLPYARPRDLTKEIDRTAAPDWNSTEY